MLSRNFSRLCFFFIFFFIFFCQQERQLLELGIQQTYYTKGYILENHVFLLIHYRIL